jgi:hypothetical protein
MSSFLEDRFRIEGDQLVPAQAEAGITVTAVSDSGSQSVLAGIWHDRTGASPDRCQETLGRDSFVGTPIRTHREYRLSGSGSGAAHIDSRWSTTLSAR